MIKPKKPSRDADVRLRQQARAMLLEIDPTLRITLARAGVLVGHITRLTNVRFERNEMETIERFVKGGWEPIIKPQAQFVGRPATPNKFAPKARLPMRLSPAMRDAAARARSDQPRMMLATSNIQPARKGQ